MENAYSVAEFSEAYTEPNRATTIQHFVKIVNSFEPLAVLAENADWVPDKVLIMAHSYCCTK